MAGSIGEVDDFFRKKNMGDAQRAGILANCKNESGFDTSASGDGGAAIGYFQWEGGRRTALQAFAKARGTTELDGPTELAFCWHELTSNYGNVLATIIATGSPENVAKWWDVGPGGAHSGTGYENSSGSTTAKRMTDARSYYQQIQAGHLPAGGSGTVSLRAWASKGHWSDFNGKHIADPPVPVTYKTPGTTDGSDPSGAYLTGPNNWNAATDKKVWEWLNLYHVGQYGPTYNVKKDDHATIVSDIGDVIRYQPKASLNETNLPDPGKADAGVTADLTPVLVKLGDILNWFTDLKNLERVGIFALGAIVLLFALIFMMEQAK